MKFHGLHSVREIIAQLQALDPEIPVYVRDSDGFAVTACSRVTTELDIIHRQVAIFEWAPATQKGGHR